MVPRRRSHTGCVHANSNAFLVLCCTSPAKRINQFTWLLCWKLTQWLYGRPAVAFGLAGAHLAAAQYGQRVLGTRVLKLPHHTSLKSMCTGRPTGPHDFTRVCQRLHMKGIYNERDEALLLRAMHIVPPLHNKFYALERGADFSTGVRVRLARRGAQARSQFRTFHARTRLWPLHHGAITMPYTLCCTFPGSPAQDSTV